MSISCLYIFCLYVYINSLYVYIHALCLYLVYIHFVYMSTKTVYMYIYIIFQISYTLSIQCIYTISYRLYIQIQTCLCRRNKNLSIQCLYDIQTILAYLSIQQLFYIDEKTSISYRHIDCRPCIIQKVARRLQMIPTPQCNGNYFTIILNKWHSALTLLTNLKEILQNGMTNSLMLLK